MITSRGREPTYRERRQANQDYWASRARSHGASLSATASTTWVRAGTLRQLRRILRPGDRVLEIGCGNGNLLGPLAGTCRAVGVDLTTEMLRVARARHAAIDMLARADATGLPFRDDSFDVVYTSRCLINVLDRRKQASALGEILRVVKPGGTVLLSENFAQFVDRLNRVKKRLRAGGIDVDAHNLRLDFAGTVRLCREKGWRPERIRGYPITSVIAHILIGGLTRRRGGRVAQRILAPVLSVFARIDDVAGRWLLPLGKDTTIVLRQTTETGAQASRARWMAPGGWGDSMVDGETEEVGRRRET